MDILDRLANLFKSFINDLSDDNSSAGESKRQFYDPDEQAAWEELNDYLNDGDTGEKKSYSGTGNNHSYQRTGTGSHQTDSELQQDFKNLEVPFGAPFDKVKQSYKKLLSQYHPDKHANDPEKLKYATQLTQKINESFLRIKKYYNKK